MYGYLFRFVSFYINSNLQIENGRIKISDHIVLLFTVQSLFFFIDNNKYKGCFDDDNNKKMLLTILLNSIKQNK